MNSTLNFMSQPIYQEHQVALIFLSGLLCMAIAATFAYATALRRRRSRQKKVDVYLMRQTQQVQAEERGKVARELMRTIARMKMTPAAIRYGRLVVNIGMMHHGGTEHVGIWAHEEFDRALRSMSNGEAMAAEAPVDRWKIEQLNHFMANHPHVLTSFFIGLAESNDENYAWGTAYG